MLERTHTPVRVGKRLTRAYNAGESRGRVCVCRMCEHSQKSLCKTINLSGLFSKRIITNFPSVTKHVVSCRVLSLPKPNPVVLMFGFDEEVLKMSGDVFLINDCFK